MKGLYLLVFSVCTSAVAFSQQLPSQIQAKKGVFTERLYLNGQWIDRIATSVPSIYDSNNNVLPTTKAMADLLRQHSIQSASVTADGDYIHNWNHKQLRIDSINHLQFDAFETDTTFPLFTPKIHNTFRLYPGMLPDSAISLTSIMRSTDNTGDSITSSFSMIPGSTVMRIDDNEGSLIAGLSAGAIDLDAYSYDGDFPQFSNISLNSRLGLSLNTSNGNFFIRGLHTVGDNDTYQHLVLNNSTGRITLLPNRVSYNQVYPATVSGTTRETSIVGNGTGSYFIPASSWKPGKTFRVTIYGTYAINGTGLINFNLKLKLGDTTIATTVTQPSSESNGQFSATINFTCATTGSAGTVYAFGNFTRSNYLFPWNNGISSSGVPKVSTIDMTTDQAVNVTAVCADTSNTVSTYIFTIEEIN